VIIWVDAQISPSIADFIEKEFGVAAASARRLGLLRANDTEIFDAARTAQAIVLTKDGDFVLQLERYGPPPKIVWLRCGNTSNSHLRELLKQLFPAALRLLDSGESLVEIVDSGGVAVEQ